LLSNKEWNSQVTMSPATTWLA